ncbi:unnamed protein product [Lactuca saligna]|uniref:Uncharacterized protein n=1 Tax=Lactuca saligna TaxID=75948 RepID=A0AA35ZYU1_LACSI|nr:unnamed protein product [Lactuca saligna]
MEATVKKFQQKFKRVKDDMDRWENLHAQLVSQFRNASSIIGRLQMESLQKILRSMTKTLEELNGVVLSLAKTVGDAKQQVKGGSVQLSMKQLHHRIGVKPSISDCLEGLRILHEMYQSEYVLKSSVTSALASLALNPSVGDLQSLEQLLLDQPNIPKEKVQYIYDIIFAEEIC